MHPIEVTVVIFHEHIEMTVCEFQFRMGSEFVIPLFQEMHGRNSYQLLQILQTFKRIKKQLMFKLLNCLDLFYFEIF